LTGWKRRARVDAQTVPQNGRVVSLTKKLPQQLLHHLSCRHLPQGPRPPESRLQYNKNGYKR
jgi:hypothetical protein